MVETTCYRKIFSDISAYDAYKMLDDKEFYCLLYTPVFAGFSSPDKFPDTFEMRCFNENFELRWTRETENAVIITEHPEGENIGTFYKRSSRYVLWGTTREPNILFEHRTGEIKIPLKVQADKKVFLKFDEFFSPEPINGNMIWRFETLKGFYTESLII